MSRTHSTSTYILHQKTSQFHQKIPKFCQQKKPYILYLQISSLISFNSSRTHSVHSTHNPPKRAQFYQKSPTICQNKATHSVLFFPSDSIQLRHSATPSTEYILHKKHTMHSNRPTFCEKDLPILSLLSMRSSRSHTGYRTRAVFACVFRANCGFLRGAVGALQCARAWTVAMVAG